MNTLACCRFTGIVGAGIVVVAVLKRIGANARCRIAGIIGAEKAVAAVLGCEHAAGRGIASIRGA